MMTTRKPDNLTTTLVTVTNKTLNLMTTQATLIRPIHNGDTTILIRGQLHGIRHDAANAVVSLILVIMVGFVVFMTVFFWRKYKHITRSIPSYQYSRLSQTEGEADLTEIVDQLGLSLGISSSDDELEPATLPVSSTQYPGPNTVLAGQCNGNALALHGPSLIEDSDEELLQ